MLAAADQKRLDDLFRQHQTGAGQLLGFPCCSAFDYSPLYRFFGFHLNNIGDPYLPSNHQMHTYDLEREVLAVFAELTHAPANSHWGYVTNGGTEGNMYGVFLARDVMLFYVFFEFTLVPLYVLINLFGSTNRKAAATKFFLFTFTGSVLTLAGIIYVAWYNATHMSPDGTWSFSFGQLQDAARAMPLASQMWVFWAFMAGFAVKVPLFPVHTWLPLAHTEAPTAGSVILAGVLLKLGTYGIFRFALGFTPQAAVYFAPTVATLAIIGIIYGGLICWVQTDVKKLVAYSSVSHLGFCVLGLFAFNSIGISGSILYMINHGLSTGALFLLIGMVYERYHTRDMGQLGGLAAKMPIWSTFMVFFAMASVGLPGLNGFVSEFMCLLGAFQAGDVWKSYSTVAGFTGGSLGPWYAFIAGTGMIVTAIYLLFMLGKIVWGKLIEPHGHDSHGSHDDAPGATPALPKDLCLREILVLAPLAILCVGLGMYPTPLLRALEAPSQLMADVQRNAREKMNPSAPLPATDDPALTPPPADAGWYNRPTQNNMPTVLPPVAALPSAEESPR